MIKAIVCASCGTEEVRDTRAKFCSSCAKKRKFLAYKSVSTRPIHARVLRVFSLSTIDIETPELTAGTDHRTDNLRCLREGIHATLRKVKEILES